MLIDKIKISFGNATDLIVRPFIIDNRKITLVMSEVLVSSDYVNEYILKRLLNIKFTSNDIENELLNFIPTNNAKVLDKLSERTLLLIGRRIQLSICGFKMLLGIPVDSLPKTK